MRHPLSDHFDGKYFHNLLKIPHGVWGFLKWTFTSKAKPWPKFPKQIPAAKPPLRVTKGIRATFVNHATILLQVDGLNLLTDPIWSDRCSPFAFAGPKRYREPGIAFEDLPPIDCVLISHDHYDHFDKATVARLIEEHDPFFVLGLGLEKLARRLDLHRVVFLDWWDSAESISPIPVTFVPAQHFSGRGAFDRNRSLWGGFVITTTLGPIYFAGDTGYGPHFKEISERLDPPVLSLLPIGAYEPRWFMRPVHMNPADAAQAHVDLKSKQSMAVHFGTFRLSDEGVEEPVTDLTAALTQQQISNERFWIPKFGESRLFEV